MAACGGVEEQLHQYLISALDRVQILDMGAFVTKTQHATRKVKCVEHFMTFQGSAIPSVLWVSCVLFRFNTSDIYSHLSNVLHYFSLFPVLHFPNNYAIFCSLLSLFQFPYSSCVAISCLSNLFLMFSLLSIRCTLSPFRWQFYKLQTDKDTRPCLATYFSIPSATVDERGGLSRPKAQLRWQTEFLMISSVYVNNRINPSVIVNTY